MDNKQVVRRHVAHFGTIAFNYSVFGAGLILFALLSTILLFLFAFAGIAAVLVYYVVLIALTIFTVGSFLLWDKFRGLWGKGLEYFEMIGNIGDYSNEYIIPFLSDALPIATAIVLVLSIVSFVCMMFDRKWEKAKSRLVFMGIVILLLIFLIIALAIGIISIGGAK